MNKTELVAVIQKQLGQDVSFSQAEKTLTAVIAGIKSVVKTSRSLQLIGFGTFKVNSRKARIGVNPKTGEKIRIKASKTVKFTVGKAFKENI